MTRPHRVSVWVGIGLLTCAAAFAATESVAASNRAMAPRMFGVDDYTVTSVPAAAFVPDFSYRSWGTSGSLGRYGETNVDQHFYASVDIPAGAEIEFMTLNNLNDGTPSVVTASLHIRFDTGAVLTWGTVPCTAHNYWLTDYSAPIGIVFQGNDYGGAAPRVLLLDVEIAASPNLQFFGTVEVWWKRTVSPAPGFATFNDVPTTDPAFQFVEALAASGVSAGCGGGNFCPDLPVTRRQMAVFLSKALGLHWPD